MTRMRIPRIPNGDERVAADRFFGSPREQRRLVTRTLNALDRVEEPKSGTVGLFTPTASAICALGQEARPKGHACLGDILMRLLVPCS